MDIPWAILLLGPLQHPQMSCLSRRMTGALAPGAASRPYACPFVPGTAVRPRPSQHVQTSCLSRQPAGPAVPGAAVLPCPL
eukprot:scaffold651706_cov46-Prasinocladus_malaysianus.AAC.1